MPHLVVEYSANLEPLVDIDRFIADLHQAMIGAGIFPLAGIRTRAVARGHYRIADGHPANVFVHAVLRMGHGRDPETRRRAGRFVFDALCDALRETHRTRPLAVSFEIQEIDPDLSFRWNNLHEIVRARSGAADAASRGGASP